VSDTANAPIGSAAGVRELLTVIFKFKFAILATFAAVVLTVTAATLLMAPTYEATARILVKFGRENVYRSEVGDVRNQVVASNTEEILNSEVSILTSRDLITQVVTTLTVKVLYPDLVAKPPKRGTAIQAAVERFGEALTVGAVRKSSIIEIALRHKDPEVAARALHLLLENFKEKHLQAYSDPQSSYLEKQLAAYAERLGTAQNQLQAYKHQNGVFSLDEQRSLLLQQRGNLDIAFKAAQSRINELRQGIASLKQQLQAVAQDVPLSTETERYRSIDDAKNQLLTLQLREQDLKRELAINDRSYRAYQERVEEARTLEDLNRQKSANISVIQAASTPIDPIRPRKGLNIAISVGQQRGFDGDYQRVARAQFVQRRFRHHRRPHTRLPPIVDERQRVPPQGTFAIERELAARAADRHHLGVVRDARLRTRNR
jgi:uncharacterized protein involved in exopolysaccharide biosynthesis